MTDFKRVAEGQVIPDAVAGWNSMVSRIEQLEIELRAARDFGANRDRLFKQATDAHSRDIATIGRALLEEAEDRDWCDEFDTAVAALNEHLTIELPERTRMFSVDIPFKAVYYGTYTVEVEASTAELAAKKALADVDSDQIDEYIGHNVLPDSISYEEANAEER